MTCILCRHFSLQNLPPGTADGDGLCTGYLESLPSLVEWDRPRCGLYRTARPLAPREKWQAARMARIAGEAASVDAPAACGAASS